jgi:hypothetical protein
MPKATLSFNLPEEAGEHDLALHGAAWALSMWDLDQALRDWLKYQSHAFKTPDEALEGARDQLHKILADRSLSLESIL